jgi:hypothetical protein
MEPWLSLAVAREQRSNRARSLGDAPWIVRSTAMVNHYYIYAVDRQRR